MQPIAHPIGLFMAGPDGAGGEYRPLERIRHDIFQRLPEGIVYGLAINAGAGAPSGESMIVDITFDARTTVRDPQKEHTVEQVTDYPIDQATRGIVWFCPVRPPRYTRYSRVGKHTVTIKVAPRAAPAAGTAGAGQSPAPRDFSEEAGGRQETYLFEIYPAHEPLDGIPERDG